MSALTTKQAKSIADHIQIPQTAKPSVKKSTAKKATANYTKHVDMYHQLLKKQTTPPENYMLVSTKKIDSVYGPRMLVKVSVLDKNKRVVDSKSITTNFESESELKQGIARFIDDENNVRAIAELFAGKKPFLVGGGIEFKLLQ